MVGNARDLNNKIYSNKVLLTNTVSVTQADGEAVLVNNHTTVALRKHYAKTLDLPELGPMFKDGRHVPGLDEGGKADIVKKFQRLYLEPRLSPLLVEQVL